MNALNLSYFYTVYTSVKSTFSTNIYGFIADVILLWFMTS